MDVSTRIQYHKPNGALIVEYTYEDGISYEKGGFKYVENDSGFSSPHNPPSREPSSQNVLRLPNKELKEETVLRKVIPGKDGRKLVNNSNKYPLCIHAQLEMRFPDGLYGGSGSMVGPHHILTCAHNVYNDTKKQWARDIQVYPAKNRNCAPFGKAKVTKAYIYENWTTKGDKNFDIALLILNQSIGQLTGWGGICCIKDNYLKEATIHVTGYPGDKGFDYMWTMDHKIQKVSSEAFEYIVDTFNGQSGSAVWSNNFGQQPNILGVHTLGSANVNYGVRISQNKFIDLIAPFISQTYGKISPPSIPPVDLVPQEIPTMAFGKAKWEKYFGDIGIEPSLPDNIEEILEKNCIFWPDKKIKETHMLTLIPKRVNDRDLTLDLLKWLIENPKTGNKTTYRYYWEEIKNNFGKQGVRNSHWVLMTKDLVPDTRGKSYSRQLEILKEKSENKELTYNAPSALDATTAILMHYLDKEIMLYQKGSVILQQFSFTRCEEEVSDGVHICVGCFNEDGISISSGNFNDLDWEDRGMSGVLSL